MFTAQAIARVCLSIGYMEFMGESPRQSSKLPDFSAKLGRPYEASSKHYHFRLHIDKDVNVAAIDITSTKNEMIDSFEELISLPAVTARYGRLTFVGATTKGSIRQKLAVMVFGENAATDARGAPKKVIRTESAVSSFPF